LPIQENEDFRNDVLDLILKEIQAEVLLGTELKRDQLKFLYQVVNLVHETPAAKQLHEKEKYELMFKNVIPRLTIYKTLQHMLLVQEKKSVEEAKLKAKEEEKKDKEEAKSPEKDAAIPLMATTRSSKMMMTSTSMQKFPVPEEKSQDQLDDEEAKKYGVRSRIPISNQNRVENVSVERLHAASKQGALVGLDERSCKNQ
jgi:hypothetical protein